MTIIAQRIESFEDACAKLGRDPAKVLPDVSNTPEQDQKAIIALLLKTENKQHSHNKQTK